MIIVMIILIVIIMMIIMVRALLVKEAPSRNINGFPTDEAGLVFFTGWSNNHFNNLHFRIQLEIQHITTCAAET